MTDPIFAITQETIDAIANQKPQVRECRVRTIECAAGYSDLQDIEIEMTVAPNEYTGDTIEVVFTLNAFDVDSETGVVSFDTAIAAHNGDWATLRDQHAMIGAAIDEFYRLGFDTKFGIIAKD